MTEDIKFAEFRKIARLNRNCVITEKIDGTNAQVYIADDGVTMHIGSRSRWLDAKNDNHGFYAWADAHREDLLKLGPGRHYGEWWGQGIQRKYGQTTKHFSLFNPNKWNSVTLPANINVVPVLYDGPFTTDAVTKVVEVLREHGSFAAPGFMDPEGVVVYHTHANQYFKVTLENDELPKSQVPKVEPMGDPTPKPDPDPSCGSVSPVEYYNRNRA